MIPTFRASATAIVALAVCVAPIPAFAAVTLVDPTPAADPGQVVLPGMQATCDAAALAHDTDGAGGDIWTGQVVLGPVTLAAGPVETGTHSITDAIAGTLVGAGTFTPAHTEILGDPYRNGGSVNMFGIKQAVGGHYSASAYDFMGTFKTTYSHAFSCDILKAVYHPAVDIFHPAVGIYVIAGDFGDSEDAIRGNCAAFTAQGSDPTNLPSWWGDPFHGGSDDNPHCKFQGTAAYTEHHDAYNDPATLQGNEAQTAINVDQTNVLRAHEDAGEGFDTSATLIIGQVVVCISPSKTGTKLPGAWAKQNGYTGDKCTTEWYNGGATVGVPNLNDGSHNWVTVPVI
jgi:hypothetical protein